METVKVNTYENSNITCYKCNDIFKALETLQIRDPEEDSPQYICKSCMKTLVF